MSAIYTRRSCNTRSCEILPEGTEAYFLSVRSIVRCIVVSVEDSEVSPGIIVPMYVVTSEAHPTKRVCVIACQVYRTVDSLLASLSNNIL